MRTKHFVLILCCVVVLTLIFIALGPPSESNDSIKHLVTQTHQQFNKLQSNLRDSKELTLDLDPKYLILLGFDKEENANTVINTPEQLDTSSSAQPSTTNTKANASNRNTNIERSTHGGVHPASSSLGDFSIVSYVQSDQMPLALLLTQHIANTLPNENLLIYALDLSSSDLRLLNSYCNNSSRCSIIKYDLSVFPSFVKDQRMHAFRPILIRDALKHYHQILFIENYMRFNGNANNNGAMTSAGQEHARPSLRGLQKRVTSQAGVLGWNSPTPVSARTHPKMFNYFQTDADNFYFLRMVDLDAVLFVGNDLVLEKILLPWLKCSLTLECIDPIGAQSNGCKYNKKPLYRYSGCHSYDTSAFNIVLGLTWHLDESQYSLPTESSGGAMEAVGLFYKETLQQAMRTLEIRHLNNDNLTSEHPFTSD